MRNILITGLPRSGTAFASVLMQLHPECVSYHEIAAYRDDWRERVVDPLEDYIADCNTYGFLKEAQYHVSKRVYLHRSPESSAYASEIATMKNVSVTLTRQLYQEALEWMRRNMGILMLDEGEIFTLDGCRKVWEYCFDDPMPEIKVEELIKLNIQQHNAHIKFGEGSVFDVRYERPVL